MTIIAEVNSLTVPAQIFAPLSATLFRLIAAIGDVATPENINDNNTGLALAFTLNEYAIIELVGLFKITQYRQYGVVTNTGDGAFKLEYQDDSNAWHDWVTGIAVHVVAGWTEWVSVSEVVCKAVRLSCTTQDTVGQSRITELEVKY